MNRGGGRSTDGGWRLTDGSRRHWACNEQQLLTGRYPVEVPEHWGLEAGIRFPRLPPPGARTWDLWIRGHVQ